MFNPFQMLRAANNPKGAIKKQLLAKMKAKNPFMYEQVQKMISGKSEDELKAMAQNIAKERGINLQEFAQNMGIEINEGE